jgi:hypothetical protein
MPTELVTIDEHNRSGFGLVRNGEQGSYDIVLRIIELVRSTVLLDKGFENFIKDTVKDAGFDSYSDTDKLFTFLYNYLKYGDDKTYSGTTYLQDVAGNIENIKSARQTLEDGFGDCDDLAILIASALAVLGYEPYLVVTAYGAEQKFSHIYVAVYHNNTRYVFDATLPDGQLNQEVIPTKKSEINVFDKIKGLDDFNGIFRGLKTMAKDASQNLLGIISLLPTGFIPKAAIQFSGAMFSGITDTDSLNTTASNIYGTLLDITRRLQQGTIALEVAQSKAREAYAQFALLDRTAENADAYDFFFKNIKQKVNYILSYGQTYSNVVTLNTSLIKYLAYGAIGFGILYIFKRD